MDDAPPTMDDMSSSPLMAFASANPMLTAEVANAGLWYAAKYFQSSSGGVACGSGACGSREEAMRAAREKQQQALAAAAEARAAATKPAATAPKPEVPAPAAPSSVEDRSEMPARMRKALERQEAAEAAVRRTTAASEPAPAPAAPPPAPASSSSSMKKESVTERLARIEKGKGASDHNPLHGHASGSSHVVKRKKGG